MSISDKTVNEIKNTNGAYPTGLINYISHNLFRINDYVKTKRNVIIPKPQHMEPYLFLPFKHPYVDFNKFPDLNYTNNPIYKSDINSYPPNTGFNLNSKMLTDNYFKKEQNTTRNLLKGALKDFKILDSNSNNQ